ncbi:hypothetical protein GCM10010252_56500 [Streptomyces aureoverticillatus]|nr:hypothetical protein GCM10010252_56500 [Streptomyces aureoverticillatus]
MAQVPAHGPQQPHTADPPAANASQPEFKDTYLCERVDGGRPIAHVAAEAGISRRCLAKWTPYGARTARTVCWITPRARTRARPARLAADLKRLHGVTIAPATVHRILVRRGLNRLRDLDPPSGEQLREVIRYEHEHVGDLVHVDVKKLGRIPTGGGWRMHGVGTDAARASKRTGPGTGKVGYTYLHSALDDHSRLAYTEALDDEKAVHPAHEREGGAVPGDACPRVDIRPRLRVRA